MSDTVRVMSQRVTPYTPRAHKVFEVVNTPRVQHLIAVGTLTLPDALPDVPLVEPAAVVVEPTRAELVAEAHSLDIDVKASWPKARIREAISEAVLLVEGPPPVLVRDDDGPTGVESPGDTDGED